MLTETITWTRADERPDADEPVLDVRASWFSLVMGAAAELEDAANCLRDPDAERKASGAAKHYRDAANALYAAPQPARVPLTGLELSRVIADAGADELCAVSGAALLRLIRAIERAHGITAEGGDRG